jgi:predicted amidohydrolase YtcJ
MDYARRLHDIIRLADAHYAAGTRAGDFGDRVGVHACVLAARATRATLDGKNPDGWVPEEKITIREAVAAYTSGSAFAEFQEGEKGTIARGRLADLVILSEDVFSIPPARIKEVSVLTTVVGGKVVHQRNP